ncbi:MAG: hypothetical protein R6V50_05080 [Thermoplasmatota archaeon]
MVFTRQLVLFFISRYAVNRFELEVEKQSLYTNMFPTEEKGDYSPVKPGSNPFPCTYMVITEEKPTISTIIFFVIKKKIFNS